MSDTANNENVDIFGDLLEYVLLEGVGLLLSLTAMVIILISSIKLYRGNNIPGAKLILIAVILTIIGSFASAFYTVFLNFDIHSVFEATINIFLGLTFLLGAYGFLSLVRYTVKKCANKSLGPDG